MKKVGDKIEWNTKAGVETGTIIGVKTQVQYTARIDRNGMYMHFLEEIDRSSAVGSVTVIRSSANIEFAQLVQEMRRLQCLYFDTKDHNALIESKRLEKKVDQVIQSYIGPSLFDKNDGDER